MKLQLVHTINLVLILNCVTIIAKNDTESEKKLDTKLNQSIYAEGFSQNPEEEPKKRIFGRKGVTITKNDTVHEEPLKSQIDNSTHAEAPSHSSIVESSTSVPITVHINNTSHTKISSNSTSMVNDKNHSDHNTSVIISPIDVSKNLSSNTPNVSTANPPLKKVELSTLKTTIKTSTTTTEKTTTTTVSHKKPEMTFSADDDPQIRDSEKNINYNVANEKSDELPKVEQDIDRTMLDEKRARNSYMLYLGLVFALPTTFVLINIAYKRIKNYLELRHYTRVDFLVDGMYVS